MLYHDELRTGAAHGPSLCHSPPLTRLASLPVSLQRLQEKVRGGNLDPGELTVAMEAQVSSHHGPRTNTLMALLEKTWLEVLSLSLSLPL